LEKWFTQSVEMATLQIVLTKEDPGLILKNHNSRQLDKEFFNLFQSKREMQIDFEKYSKMKSTKKSIMQSFKKDDGLVRRPVDCSYLYMEWLF